MLGSDVLDVVIALSFIFFLLSIVASAAQELISQAVAWRAKTLKEGVGRLLADPTVTGLAAQVWSHPLITSLDKPSYLKGTRFADSLMDTLVAAQAAGQTTFETVLAAIEALPAGDVKTQLQTVVRQGGQTLDDLRTAIATWFDDSMDRLTGVYKRNTQKVLVLLGLVMAVLFNVDAIATSTALANNPSARDAIVAEVSTITDAKLTTTADEAVTRLRALDFGIGWDVCWYATTAVEGRPPTELPTPCGQNLGGQWPPIDAWFNYIVLRIPGWILTALAVMLGAPFWFDTLSKLANLRATGKVEDGSAGK